MSYSLRHKMSGTTEKKVNTKIKVLSKPFEISFLFIIFRGIWIMFIFFIISNGFISLNSFLFRNSRKVLLLLCHGLKNRETWVSGRGQRKETDNCHVAYGQRHGSVGKGACHQV